MKWWHSTWRDLQMTIRGKAALIGVGGTLAYYGLAWMLLRMASAFDWDLGLTNVVLVIPLIPGLLAGLPVALLLMGTGMAQPGIHDGGPLLICLAEAPLANAYFVFLWLRRKAGTS